MIWQLTTTFTTLEELEDFYNYLKEHNSDGCVIRTESTVKKVAEAKKEKAYEPKAAEEPAEIFDEITFEELRAELTQIARAGHNEGIQDIIKSKGVKKLSDIDASLYGEVLAEARKLTA